MLVRAAGVLPYPIQGRVVTGDRSVASSSRARSVSRNKTRQSNLVEPADIALQTYLNETEETRGGKADLLGVAALLG